MPPDLICEKLDFLVEKLRGNRKRWLEIGPEQRCNLLGRCLENTLKFAAEWVDLSVKKKSIPPLTPAAAEEVLAGPVPLARHLRLWIRTLRQVAATGLSEISGEVRQVRDSCVLAVDVFPETRLDSYVYGGLRAETWLDPEVTSRNFDSRRAAAYRDRPGDGGVALILGAGNVSSIAPLDVLTRLIQESQVCLLKMNPVNEYLTYTFERIFGPLILEGFVAITRGDAAVGKYLAEHPGVDSVHLTGSDRTFDAIVWGEPGEEREGRKQRGERLNCRPVTAELGCVTPVIVVPGAWRRRDLAFHAENLASMVANNASFNCNAPQVLSTAADWPQRQALLDQVREALSNIPERKAYYPGAFERYQAIRNAHPDRAERLSRGVRAEVIPWTLVPGLDPEAKDEVCFQTEAFCGVLAETAPAFGANPPP